MIAGVTKPDEAQRKVRELDVAASKLGADRMLRGISTPDMDAALERFQKAKTAFDQVLAPLRPS